MSDAAAVPEVTTAELAEALAGGAPLIDVRQPDEYAAARVPGARLIPLDQLAERAGEVPKEGPVYVICAVGGRSARAVEALNGGGWDTVNVAGGTKQWLAEGRPVERGVPA